MIDSLQSWFTSVCDGEWEHQYGIKIESVDNPGWCVEIDLSGTSLDGHAYESRKVERGGNDWFMARVEDSKFIAGCGPSNLSEAIAEFKLWANGILVDSPPPA